LLDFIHGSTEEAKGNDCFCAAYGEARYGFFIFGGRLCNLVAETRDLDYFGRIVARLNGGNSIDKSLDLSTNNANFGLEHWYRNPNDRRAQLNNVQ
jgi:hypothetical protein